MSNYDKILLSSIAFTTIAIGYAFYVLWINSHDVL
jgi:hypothetical protein